MEKKTRIIQTKLELGQDIEMDYETSGEECSCGGKCPIAHGEWVGSLENISVRGNTIIATIIDAEFDAYDIEIERIENQGWGKEKSGVKAEIWY